MNNEYSIKDELPTSEVGTPDVDALIERYLSHLQVLNYSPRTLATLSGFYNIFRRFLRETKTAHLHGITGSLLHDFQRWVYYQPTHRGTARSVSSQNQTMRAVKGLMRFGLQEGYLTHDPAQSLLYAREPDALPRHVLTPPEARKVIETPDVKTLLGYRDRTILEVLYATGIRKSELMNLTLDDVNLEEELLRINQGKGRRDRVVPLSGIACSFLENYIKGIRPEFLKASDAQKNTRRLFISLRGRPMSSNGVGDVVEKYGRLSRVKKRVTCHIWRHTCATHLLQNNANLRHVQEMLGHRSLATTERYLRLTITDLKEAHRKYHPREQRQSEERERGTTQSNASTRITSTRSKNTRSKRRT